MAWNYDYPYVDATQPNDDWFIGVVKRVEEEINGVEGIRKTASEAKSIAENAKDVANNAKSRAEDAVTFSNEALNESEIAVTKADGATSTANNAMTRAKSAETIAQNADVTATGVSNKVSGYDKQFSEINAKISNHTDQITKLRSDVNGHDTVIGDIQVEIESVKSDVAVLNADNATQKQQLLEMSLSNVQRDSKIETNENNIAQNTTDVDALKVSNSNLASRVAKLEVIRPGQNYSSVDIYEGHVDTQFTYPSSWVTCASIMQVEPLVEYDNVRNNTTVHCRFSKKRTSKLNNNTIYGLGAVTVNMNGDDYFVTTEGSTTHAYYTAIPVTCALLKDVSGTPTLAGIGTGIVFVDEAIYTPTGVATQCWGFRLLTQSFMESVTECDGFIVEFSYYNTEGGLVSTTE